MLAVPCRIRDIQPKLFAVPAVNHWHLHELAARHRLRSLARNRLSPDARSKGHDIATTYFGRRVYQYFGRFASHACECSRPIAAADFSGNLQADLIALVQRSKMLHAAGTLHDRLLKEA